MRGGEEGLPLDGDGKLPGTRAGLDDNVGVLDAGLDELGLGTGHEGLNDGLVPAGVDNGDAQAGAVVLLRGGTLERHGWRGAGAGAKVGCFGWCRGRELVGVLGRIEADEGLEREEGL